MEVDFPSVLEFSIGVRKTPSDLMEKPVVKVAQKKSVMSTKLPFSASLKSS